MRSPNSRTSRYEILVEGHLDIRWTSWFDEMAIITRPDGTTVLCGTLPDQAALQGVLQKLRDAGLPLISVTPVNTTRNSS